MAEYVRFVSYLYEYQGNERKKNVGFVRYEVRAGQKRLMVSVNGVRRPDERIPVYAFYRELDSCIGVKLGTLVLRGTRGTFQYSTYADGPGDGEPECRFEEIAGVMVMGEADTPVFCTVWDNEPFLVSSFVRCRQDLVRIRAASVKERENAGAETAAAADNAMPDEGQTAEQQPVRNMEQQTEMAGEAVTEQRTETVQEPEALQEQETVREPETVQSTENVQETETVQEQEPPQETETVQAAEQEKPQETAAPPDKTERMRESYALYRQTVWERMCKLYPKVMPFPYNCQIGALRIRPGDIGRLPKENWALANNSFMLHGFFQYRYILLLRLPAQTEEYEERYMIAVPGVYSQMDNYLADMFGFHEFFGSPKQGSESGRFGYWVQEVRMEQGT